MFSQQVAWAALDEALFGYAMREMSKIGPSDRFAHYTSLDAATNIIGGDASGKRNLWLRDASMMNDFMEVTWGQDCLIKTLENWRLHKRFKRIVEQIGGDIFEPLIAALNTERLTLGSSVYLLSLTLHNEMECQTGKLSMWRAYGGAENVCLVFNTAPFINHQSAYETVLSPVIYADERIFAREFEALMHRLEPRVHLLRSISPENMLVNFKRALDFAVFSTKHPGFHEEAEWRIIHQHSGRRPDPPSIRDPSNPSKCIYQIPLENRSDAGIWGADLDEVLDRVIIGPTNNARESIDYYIGLLKKAGVTHAEDRVSLCGIPLRREPSRAWSR